ncbi:MAG: serine/threonine-protein kinase [Gemmataceae bacterium]
MPQQLEEYLLEWEERRDRGEPASPRELCPDWPEGQAELARQIHLLEWFDRLLVVKGDGAANEPAVPFQHFAGYEVRGELGRGGMGVVYRVWDPLLCREAALKMLLPTALPAQREEAQRLGLRFQREAQVLAQLKHDNIVPIFEAKVQDGVPYFVMESVAGGSLSAHRLAMTEAGPRLVVPFVEKVARAVHHAHGKGVLHRDLKPGNILLDASGNPRVSDFGLAKLLSDEADPEGETVPEPAPPAGPSAAGQLTVSGFQPGTPGYMAPEQFDPTFGRVGPATDVWALGVVLYELLTGQRPFGSGPREALRPAVCDTLPPSPRSLDRRIDRRIEMVVLRCLEKDPNKRWRSAGALADQLARWSRTRRLGRRAVAGLAGLVLAAAAAGLTVREMQPERRFTRQVDPLLSRLARGEEIEVVRPGGEVPAHRVRCGEGHTQVRGTDEGVTVASPSLGMVEFLPHVPWPHYRVLADVRHDAGWNWRNGFGGVGVAFTGRHVDSPAGPQHVVAFLGFDDWNGDFLPVSGAKGPKKSRAILQLLWYLDRPTDGKTPFKMQVRFPPNRTAFYDSPPQGLKPVRQVSIEVAPGGTTVRWSDPTQPPLGPLAPPVFREFEQSLREHNPELVGVDFTPMNRPAIGILVAGGQCTLLRLRVVPQPTPPE